MMSYNEPDGGVMLPQQPVCDVCATQDAAGCSFPELVQLLL